MMDLPSSFCEKLTELQTHISFLFRPYIRNHPGKKQILIEEHNKSKLAKKDGIAVETKSKPPKKRRGLPGKKQTTTSRIKGSDKKNKSTNDSGAKEEMDLDTSPDKNAAENDTEMVVPSKPCTPKTPQKYHSKETIDRIIAYSTPAKAADMAELDLDTSPAKGISDFPSIDTPTDGTKDTHAVTPFATGGNAKGEEYDLQFLNEDVLDFNWNDPNNDPIDLVSSKEPHHQLEWLASFTMGSAATRRYMIKFILHKLCVLISTTITSVSMTRTALDTHVLMRACLKLMLGVSLVMALCKLVYSSQV